MIHPTEAVAVACHDAPAPARAGATLTRRGAPDRQPGIAAA
jgi:hypothetical protein